MKKSTQILAFLAVTLLFQFQGANAQDWWTKTKKEAIPGDLTQTVLLVEKFKTLKLDAAPEQAYLNPKKKEHPLIKKTNDHLKEYNSELKTIFKQYNHRYKLASKRSAEDTEKFGLDTCKYTLRHEVYLRKYQQAGNTTHFYTYVFYFHDRATGKDFPYIYLFEKKRLKSLEKLVGYLNEL